MVILALATFHPTTRAVALEATSSVDSRIRLHWEVGARYGGRPVIHGYVYNDYLRGASDVRLLVETLDASGTAIARDVGSVRGVVGFKNRDYFGPIAGFIGSKLVNKTGERFILDIALGVVGAVVGGCDPTMP
jgi:hypothetical protein